MSIPLSSLPKKYQAAAVAQMTPRESATVKQNLQVQNPQIRQRSGDGMNKLERAFFQLLNAFSRVPFYVHREVSLPLANGCRYKVDFIRVHTGQTGPIIEGFEVKGFKRDDAIVKLKVAASVYPWIKFYLVTRKNKIWDYQEVNA